MFNSDIQKEGKEIRRDKNSIFAVLEYGKKGDDMPVVRAEASSASTCVRGVVIAAEF